MYTHGVETVDGRKILFEDMTDEHLANWIYHAEVYMPLSCSDNTRQILRREAERRKLSKEFIDKADGSFTARDGRRMRFDKVAKMYVEVT